MKHWITLLGLCVLMWIFYNCDFLTNGGGGTETEGLSGQIVNSQGAPVSGASVRVYFVDSSAANAASDTNTSKDSTVTDEDGRYRFPKLQDGHYNVQSSYEKNGATQVTFLSGIVLKGGLNLGIDTLRASGSIYTAVQSNGSAVAGVLCYVPGSSFIAISDDSGHCFISGMPPGFFKVRMSYPGLLTVTSNDVLVESGITANAGTFSLIADPSLAPPTPAGLSVQYDSTSGIATLTWNPVHVSDLAGYAIYRRQTLTETPEKISVNLVTSTTFKDTLRRGDGDNSRALYLYQVKAQDEDGNLSVLFSDPVGITAVPPAQQGQFFSLNASTVALWTFNSHHNGTFTDLSPNAFNLSNANTFSLTASPYDSAVIFSGVGSAAASDVSHSNASALTIGATGKITYEVRLFVTPATSQFGWVIGTYDGVSLNIGPNGELQATGQKTRNGTGYWINEETVPGVVPTNRWVTIAVAFDQSNGEAYGYVDGVPVQLYSYGTTNPITDPFRVSTGSFFVGNNGQDNYQFKGIIDEIRVSNSLILGAGLPLIGTPPPVQTVTDTTHTSTTSQDTTHHFAINSSTVALWTFNGHSNGTFTDLSSNGFNLSSANSFSLASSPYDSAAVFTGTGSVTDVTHANTSALTIGATGKITYEVRLFVTPATSQFGWVIGTYDGVSLNIGPNGELQATGQKVRNGTGYWIDEETEPGAVPTNQWVDIAVAFDQSNGEAYGYVNGTPVQLYSSGTSNPITDPFRVSTGSFYVGNNGQDNYQFKGKIDEIRMSNSLVLGPGLPLIATPPPSLVDTTTSSATAQDTTHHFAINSSTIALWTFNNHSSGAFTDLSSNGYNLSGANSFSLASSPFDSAAVFTGTGSVTDVTHANTSALTIGATGKITYEVRLFVTPATSQFGWVIGTYDGVSLNIGQNGELQATGQKVRNGTGYWINEETEPGAVPTNQWVDIAVAFDQSNGEAYGYVNGTPVQLYSSGTSNPITDPFRVSTGSFFVGNNGQDAYQFKGKIDEIRMSNSLVLGPGLPLIATPPP